MNHEQFVENVLVWAKARKIIPNSSVDAQAGKTLEEVTELWQARVNRDKIEIADSIGDIAVTLIIGHHLNKAKDDEDIYISRHEPTSAGEYWREGCQRIINYTIDHDHQHAFRELERLCKGQRLDFSVCCRLAWDEIKDRKGTTDENGVFYKE